MARLITVPRPLREALGYEASDALVDLLNAVHERQKENAIKLAEQKFEGRLAEETARFIKWMLFIWAVQFGISLVIMLKILV